MPTIQAANDNGPLWGRLSDAGRIQVSFDHVLVQRGRPPQIAKVWYFLDQAPQWADRVGNDNRARVILRWAEEVYGYHILD